MRISRFAILRDYRRVMNAYLSSPIVALVLRLAAFVLFALPICAQQNWRWANSLPASIGWTDTAFGNGVYVAVGRDATIATSPDAIAWTIRRMSTANMHINSVTFANGRFVAAGLGTPTAQGAGLVMTSTDGMAWTINTTLPSGIVGQLTDVVYGGGTWIIGGAGNGRVLASTDGLTWTLRAAGTNLFRGTYGAGRFVYTASSNVVSYSTDGITWTQAIVAGAANANTPAISDLAFANGKFVAVGRGDTFNAVAYTSADGATWTASAAFPSGNTALNSVSAGSSSFFAASQRGGYSSADGITWTQRTSVLPIAQRQTDANAESTSWTAAANGQFFVLGSYGSIITSTDGATWTRRSTGTVNDLSGLIHDGTRFVATGAGGTVLTSPDGAAWTTVTTGTTSHFGKTAFNGTRYVTADFSGILHSTNLTAWTAVAGTAFDRWSGVAYGNGRFVATLTSTLRGVRTSTDGVTWTADISIPNTGGGSIGIHFGAGVFVIPSSGGFSAPVKILSSLDGAAWTDRTPAGITGNVQLMSSAFGGGRFVILTSDKRSLTSTDGTTWTINTLPSTSNLFGVHYVGSQFVARGDDFGASSYVSADGATWTLLENSTAPNILFNAMVGAGGVVVGVGSQGMILLGDLPASPNAPKIAAAPKPQTISPGGSAVFSVGATGNGLTYQWRFNGTAIPGANSATYVLRAVTAANAGNYVCVITNAFGSSTTSAAVLTISTNPDFGRITNLSILTDLTVADPLFTVGTFIGGAGTTGSKPLLVRAVGPSLAGVGVPAEAAVADPKLEIFSGQTSNALNDNWGGDSALVTAFTRVAAFGYLNAASRDAAVFNPTTPAGGYTIQVSGVAGATGLVIAELYDSTPAAAFLPATPRLVNVSVLKNIPTGGLLTAGFVIGGSTAKTVLVRVIGPRLGLDPFNMGGTMADPKLDLYSGQTVIASNDNWGGDGQLAAVGASVGAFAVADAASKDAMLIVTLAPGPYTVEASPVTGTGGGQAIIEIYEVP